MNYNLFIYLFLNMPAVLSKLDFCIVCDYCGVPTPSCYIEVSKKHSRCHMCRNRKYDLMTRCLDGPGCGKANKRLKKVFKDFDAWANGDEVDTNYLTTQREKQFRPLDCLG